MCRMTSQPGIRKFTEQRYKKERGNVFNWTNWKKDFHIVRINNNKQNSQLFISLGCTTSNKCL